MIRRNWSDPERYLGYSAPTNGGKHFGRNSNLYFMRSGEFVKIGIADDVEVRLAQFEAGNPFGIRLAAKRQIPKPVARQIEGRMHSHYADFAVGREWFRGVDVREACRIADRHIRDALRAIDNWRADGFILALDGPPDPELSPVAISKFG